MDELASIMNSVARLMAIIAGGLSVIALCYAGILWMTASGDPGKMGQARGALMGAVVGLIIVGVAFIVPRVISQVVIEPVGGVSLQSDVGLDCDTVLRQQLIFQRAASTATKMNTVISQIQSQRSECQSDVWDPMVNDVGYINHGSPVVSGCWANSDASEGSDGTVGPDQLVPRSLRSRNLETESVRETSGRDSDNNIIVYFADTPKRPSDSASCWLYVSRLRTWSENY